MSKVKKGTQIWSVHIENGIVSAMDVHCETIALTRTQRNILRDYKSPDYIDNIKKEFCNPNIIHKDFSVLKDGVLIYSYTK